ncbi:hypothetical protein [Amaricoccus macauensis]|uniref:hypothetical protein n=1 Tax=Amaricoccus macauensis TaxID=57001 RepID=UPI003C7A8BB0
MIRFIAFCTALALATPLSAQMSEDVHFSTGNYGTTVEGSVTGNEYRDYRVGAEKGQEMLVELTVTESDGNGTVYFNILPPGSAGEAIHIGSMDGNAITQTLPKSGTYTIRVYQMGNDKDTGKASAFRIALSIR